MDLRSTIEKCVGDVEGAMDESFVVETIEVRAVDSRIIEEDGAEHPGVFQEATIRLKRIGAIAGERCGLPETDVSE